MPRPDGAYDPVVTDRDPIRPADAGSGFTPTTPDTPLPDQGNGGGSGGPGGDAGGVGKGGDPASPLEGQYLLRTQVHSVVAHDNLGTVDNTVTTYSMAQFYVDDESGELKTVEKQCYVDYDHQPRTPGNSMTTTVADAVPQSAPAPHRVVELETDGSWRTLPAPVAVGWEWDFAEQGEHALPTSESDSLVKDADGDGEPGVTLRVRANAGIQSGSCEFYVVQRVDLVYQGQLDAEGRLDGGRVIDNGSETHELGTDGLQCASGDAQDRTPANTVHPLKYAPAPEPFDDTWTCPSESTFRSALPY